VFIEALEAAGVKVDAATVEPNPTQLLPPKNSYAPSTQVAELIGLPYADYAKLILKVSYNIGADTSLVLWGLTQGVDNLTAALQVEQGNLASHFGITPNEYHFLNGSGGSTTTAINGAVTKLLLGMTATAVFPTYFDAFPILGVDGSLSFVKDFQSDPTLAGATGQVRAKTGTFVAGSATGIVLRGQAFGGYITTKSGRQLVFQLVVNNVPLANVLDVVHVFQDEGTISAILWRDN
ncbi:MAG: D-alanyl-D-alanine carboxypeptidase, partial [Candidatus Acidiferrales bacterium]